MDKLQNICPCEQRTDWLQKFPCSPAPAFVLFVPARTGAQCPVHNETVQGCWTLKLEEFHTANRFYTCVLTEFHSFLCFIAKKSLLKVSRCKRPDEHDPCAFQMCSVYFTPPSGRGPATDKTKDIKHVVILILNLNKNSCFQEIFDTRFGLSLVAEADNKTKQ